ARNPSGFVQRTEGPIRARLEGSLYMSARLWAAAIAIAGSGFIASHTFSRSVVVPASAAGAPEQDRSTTLDDQTELGVTVYNSDIALVRDVRNLDLARGTSNLRFMDIAATVNPATVHFRSLTDPSNLSVLEQNYEYDLLEPGKLLQKYVRHSSPLLPLV